MGANGIPYVVPIAFADSHDETVELGERVQYSGDEFAVVAFPRLGVFSQGRSDRFGRGNHIRGQKDSQPEFILEKIEQDREFLPEDINPFPDFRLVQCMRGEVRVIIQCHRCVSELSDLMGEVPEISGNLIPLLPPLRAIGGEMGKWDLRPVDALLFVTPEKWTDGVDEEKIHGPQHASAVGQNGRASLLYGVVTIKPVTGDRGGNIANRNRVVRDREHFDSVLPIHGADR